MVESQLSQTVVPKPIAAAVANLSHKGTFGEDNQGGNGGAHALEIFVGPAALVNPGIRIVDGGYQGVGGRLVCQFMVSLRDDISSELAGQLSGSVGSHAVGDDEQVSPALQCLRSRGHDDSHRILVVGASETDVAQSGTFKAVFPVGSVLIHGIVGGDLWLERGRSPREARLARSGHSPPESVSRSVR